MLYCAVSRFLALLFSLMKPDSPDPFAQEAVINTDL